MECKAEYNMIKNYKPEVTIDIYNIFSKSVYFNSIFQATIFGIIFLFYDTINECNLFFVTILNFGLPTTTTHLIENIKNDIYINTVLLYSFITFFQNLFFYCFIIIIIIDIIRKSIYKSLMSDIVFIFKCPIINFLLNYYLINLLNTIVLFFVFSIFHILIYPLLLFKLSNQHNTTIRFINDNNTYQFLPLTINDEIDIEDENIDENVEINILNESENNTLLQDS